MPTANPLPRTQPLSLAWARVGGWDGMLEGLQAVVDVTTQTVVARIYIMNNK